MFYLFDPNLSELQKFFRTLHFIVIILFTFGFISFFLSLIIS